MSTTIGIRVQLANRHLPYGAFTKFLQQNLERLGFHFTEHPDHSITAIEHGVYVQCDSLPAFLRLFEAFTSLTIECYDEQKEMLVVIRDSVD